MVPLLLHLKPQRCAHTDVPDQFGLQKGVLTNLKAINWSDIASDIADI